MPLFASRLASRDELGELLKRPGSLELAAAIEAEVENMLTRGLERRIGERSRLVERPPVAMVARVERPHLDKTLKSQAFTRHVEQSRPESSDRMEVKRYGRKYPDCDGVRRTPNQKNPLLAPLDTTVLYMKTPLPSVGSFICMGFESRMRLSRGFG